MREKVRALEKTVAHLTELTETFKMHNDKKDQS
jgi:hypothetical protein